MGQGWGEEKEKREGGRRIKGRGEGRKGRAGRRGRESEGKSRPTVISKVGAYGVRVPAADCVYISGIRGRPQVRTLPSIPAYATGTLQHSYKLWRPGRLSLTGYRHHL